MDAHHLVSVKPNPKVPPFRPGDTVQVSYTIREGERVRTQAFQGVVIRCVGGKSPAATFTVRRISHGIGVERIFPLYSPHIDSVNVLRHGKVRRARLYYLRERFGRAARLKERVVRPGEGAVAAVPEAEEEIEAETVEEVVEELGVVAVEEGVAETEEPEADVAPAQAEDAAPAEEEEAPIAEAEEVAEVVPSAEEGTEEPSGTTEEDPEAQKPAS